MSVEEKKRYNDGLTKENMGLKTQHDRIERDLKSKDEELCALRAELSAAKLVPLPPISYGREITSPRRRAPHTPPIKE